MAYFPMLYSMNNKKVLLVGAGVVAFRKLRMLLDFTENITIISSCVSNDINIKSKEYNLEIKKRDYNKGDAKGFDIVIVAIDNIDLQEKIYFECKEKKILYNCSDIQKYCDFIFPSYIKEGDLTIAISTNGSSPAFAKRFKEYIKKFIPKDVNIFLQEMKELRVTQVKGKSRMKFLDEKVKEYVKSWN